VAGLQWVVDAYTLGFAAFLLSAGLLSDRLGAKRAFITGFAIFSAASLACGLASAPSFLNFTRGGSRNRRGAAGAEFAGDTKRRLRSR